MSTEIFYDRTDEGDYSVLKVTNSGQDFVCPTMSAYESIYIQDRSGHPTDPRIIIDITHHKSICEIYSGVSGDRDITTITPDSATTHHWQCDTQRQCYRFSDKIPIEDIDMESGRITGEVLKSSRINEVVWSFQDG